MIESPARRLCTIEGCDRKHAARGYCNRHYNHVIRGVKPRPQSKALMRKDPADPRHGTLNGYGNCKCRCPRCTDAKAKSMREYLDADPERRRRWNEYQRARLHATKEDA